jgi:hypothetical protein
MTITVGIAVECKIFSQENILEKLISETKAMFREEGIPRFVSFLASELDRAVCEKLRDEVEWSELHTRCLGKRCCAEPRFERTKIEHKRLISTLGAIKLDWIRLRCKNCRLSFIPMRAVLGVEKYQSESQEFVKLACETVVQQSYRRAKKHLSQIGGIEVTHTRLHRIIMNSDCDVINPDIRGTEIKYLIADGTGYPEFRLKSQEKPNQEGEKKKFPKSEIKTVIGITAKNEIIPIGVWTRKTWKGIAQTIKKANNHPKLKPKPIADILICDGEESLVRYMGRLTCEVQRCQWHIPHDFFHLMRYQEDADKKTSADLTKKLHEAIHIEMPTGPKSKAVDDELERMILKAEISVAELITELRFRRHKQAAVYLENAKNYLFTYLRYWLATGILPPKASSRIERLMREFKRRIKKIGFNWSANGVAKITRILLKLLASEMKWEEHWKKKLRLDLDVSIRFSGIAKMA